MTVAKIMSNPSIHNKVRATQLLGVVNKVLNEMKDVKTDIRSDVENIRKRLGKIVRNELEEGESAEKIIKDAEFCMRIVAGD